MDSSAELAIQAATFGIPVRPSFKVPDALRPILHVRATKEKGKRWPTCRVMANGRLRLIRSQQVYQGVLYFIDWGRDPRQYEFRYLLHRKLSREDVITPVNHYQLQRVIEESIRRRAIEQRKIT